MTERREDEQKSVRNDAWKYRISAVVFLILIAVTAIATPALNVKALGKAFLRRDEGTSLASAVEGVYDDGLFGLNRYVELWSFGQRALGTSLYDDAAYGYIIKDNHGMLHFPAAHADVAPCADAVKKLSADLKESGIPFLYVQAPNKKLEGYTVFPPGACNYSNEDADAFLEMAAAEGVPVLDLREAIIEQNLVRKELFYKTDHHWTTPAAFWAFGEVVEELNTRFGFTIDPDGYYRDTVNWKSERQENCYLGSQGRRVGRYAAGLDDYTFLSPLFATDFTLVDRISDPDHPLRTGDFMEAIVDTGVLTSTNVTDNKHASYFTWDYGNLVIYNHKEEDGLRILLVKDSFALPFGAFLSCAVSELHMVDLRDSGAPAVAEYARENQIDAVIVMYNTEVFGSDMFRFENR